MHTIAFLFTRRPGMTRNEFEHHYKVIHAPTAAKLPGLLEYRHYPVREANRGDVHADIRPVSTRCRCTPSKPKRPPKPRGIHLKTIRCKRTRCCISTWKR
ncbi:EthD domain-containing protein [Paraburkholderia sp. BL25I1N1]|nr:EthD domain-containing protein [Paraburkholderia sp. BL25I1N1]